MFSQLCVCVCVLCKMNVFQLSSLSSAIIDSASCWVGGRWFGGYVVVGRLVSGLWIS